MLCVLHICIYKRAPRIEYTKVENKLETLCSQKLHAVVKSTIYNSYGYPPSHSYNFFFFSDTCTCRSPENINSITNSYCRMPRSLMISRRTIGESPVKKVICVPVWRDIERRRVQSATDEVKSWRSGNSLNIREVLGFESLAQPTRMYMFYVPRESVFEKPDTLNRINWTVSTLCVLRKA